jgi:hypothetical protein
VNLPLSGLHELSQHGVESIVVIPTEHNVPRPDGDEGRVSIGSHAQRELFGSCQLDHVVRRAGNPSCTLGTVVPRAACAAGAPDQLGRTGTGLDTQPT